MSSYPARCVIGLERRTLPGDTREHIDRELAALGGSKHSITLVREPFEVDPDSAVVTLVSAAAAQVLGAEPKVAGASYWADAAFIAAAGVPTVMFGPGGEGAHAIEEWVSIRDTVAVTRVLVAVAQDLCSSRT
jgi:acetylornithine deacetylase